MTIAVIETEKLSRIVERIEAGNVEVDDARDFVKDIYLEAKSLGYDTKAIRNIVKLRKMASHERQEQDEIIRLYRDAVGV